MRVIDVKKRDLNIKEYKSRYATESDAEILIKGDALLVEDGKPILLYKTIDWTDTEDLRTCCKKIKYNTATRIANAEKHGISTTSAIFGFRGRSPLRQDYCSVTQMASTSPKEHTIICNFASNLSEIYKEYFPDTYAYHNQKSSEVLSEWRIPNSVFTSGIINKDNVLQYHHDSGNINGALSNMVAFKNGVAGGFLVLPEYNIKLQIEDNTLTIFDGAGIVHGVTPFKKFTDDAYRYTIVYYSLSRMWKCETIKDEVNRIRKVKKAREIKRLAD